MKKKRRNQEASARQYCIRLRKIAGSLRRTDRAVELGRQLKESAACILAYEKAERSTAFSSTAQDAVAATLRELDVSVALLRQLITERELIEDRQVSSVFQEADVLIEALSRRAAQIQSSFDAESEWIKKYNRQKR